MVLESRYRWDVAVVRNGEARVQSSSYLMGRLEVLTVVHLERDGTRRIVSCRPASESESEACYGIGKEDD